MILLKQIAQTYRAVLPELYESCPNREGISPAFYVSAAKLLAFWLIVIRKYVIALYISFVLEDKTIF